MVRLGLPFKEELPRRVWEQLEEVARLQGLSLRTALLRTIEDSIIGSTRRMSELQEHEIECCDPTREAFSMPRVTHIIYVYQPYTNGLQA